MAIAVLLVTTSQQVGAGLDGLWKARGADWWCIVRIQDQKPAISDQTWWTGHGTTELKLGINTTRSNSSLRAALCANTLLCCCADIKNIIQPEKHFWNPPKRNSPPHLSGIRNNCRYFEIWTLRKSTQYNQSSINLSANCSHLRCGMYSRLRWSQRIRPI